MSTTLHGIDLTTLNTVTIPPHALDGTSLVYFHEDSGEAYVEIDARHLPLPKILSRCTHRDATGRVFEITGITAFEKPQRDALDQPYTHTLTLTPC